VIYLFFFIACTGTTFFYRRKKQLESSGSHTSLAYLFAKNALVFVVPLTCVVTAYAALSLVLLFVDHDSTTIHTLIYFETAVTRLLDIADYLKLSTWQSFGVLLLLFCFALGHALLSRRHLEDYAGLQNMTQVSSVWFSRYSRFVTTCYMILTLVVSFTFFGSALANDAGKLQLRIKNTRQNLERLNMQLTEAVNAELKRQVFVTTLRQAPPTIAAAAHRSNFITPERELTQLAREYPIHPLLSPRANEVLFQIERRHRDIEKLLAEPVTSKRVISVGSHIAMFQQADNVTPSRTASSRRTRVTAVT
jgi:hypothetical protein